MVVALLNATAVAPISELIGLFFCAVRKFPFGRAFGCAVFIQISIPAALILIHFVWGYLSPTSIGFEPFSGTEWDRALFLYYVLLFSIFPATLAAGALGSDTSAQRDFSRFAPSPIRANTSRQSSRLRELTVVLPDVAVGSSRCVRLNQRLMRSFIPPSQKQPAGTHRLWDHKDQLFGMWSGPTFTTKATSLPHPMSEFSESYHLRTENVENACSLLRRAGIKGFVFPAINGWVTFVADGETFKSDASIVAATKQPLLHYVNAEDHGWGFTLYDRNPPVSAYRCDWDESVTYDGSGYSREAIMRVVLSVDPEALDELESELRPSDPDDVFGSEPSRLFAEAVGLERYEWLSYHYVAKDIEHSEDEFEGLVKVP